MNLRVDYTQFDGLEKAIEQYKGNAEQVINNVFHNEGAQLISDAIINLMPRSAANKRHAKDTNSLTSVNANLSVTVKSKSKYSYLYFPDDGTNTKRHVGNQQFFLRGAENVADDIIERCINNLVNEFEKGE